ncbi:MAG: transposase [Candidatus Accumulibacter meliphilus]|jgi:putative transposase|uniref:transposase n=1 Tax=Candidatus Accumulibacter meliphilus TaxID=2211374 RepID=UPI002FC2A8EA
MARPLRLEFVGALYHVTARGDGREDIYRADCDRRVFLDVLADVRERFNWTIHAYCLMTNHYHLLVETPDANLARGMRQLNGVYTQRFNRSYDRVGHVFQGRYKAILVEKNVHLLELTRYVVLNPVRARMVRTPGEWPWSSYRAMLGEADSPEWLDIRHILAAFGKREGQAAENYARFVADGVGQPSPWERLKSQMFLGSDAFVESMRQKVPKDRDLRELPHAKGRAPAQPLAHYARSYPGRDEAIAAAFASGGYTLKDIGDYFGLHYSPISKIVRAQSHARGMEKVKT